MYTGRLISSDDHVFEPIDLWTTRTDKAYLDRAPHIVREPEEDWWVCGEQKAHEPRARHSNGAAV